MMSDTRTQTVLCALALSPALSLCYQSVKRVRASYVLGCMPRLALPR